jgi:hypothetical protein
MLLQRLMRSRWCDDVVPEIEVGLQEVVSR